MPTSRVVQEQVARLLAAAKSSGEVDHYAGKRQDVRISDGVALEMTEDLSRPAKPVSMHNISEGGCAFWLRRKIELHTPIYVREFTADNSAAWVPGHVTHCTQGIRGYLIGVAFGDPEAP